LATSTSTRVTIQASFANAAEIFNSLPQGEHTGRVGTERTKNSCRINARVGLRLLPVLRVTFRKVQRLGLRNTHRFQPLTKSVLNRPSPEVWRKAARESEFSRWAGSVQCRGLRAKARVYWGFFYPDEPAENILCGATGGPTLSALWKTNGGRTIGSTKMSATVAQRVPPFSRHSPRTGPIVYRSKTANARVVAIRRTRDAKLSAPQLPLP
jgi:hypothetical protein